MREEETLAVHGYGVTMESTCFQLTSPFTLLSARSRMAAVYDGQPGAWTLLSSCCRDVCSASRRFFTVDEDDSSWRTERACSRQRTTLTHRYTDQSNKHQSNQEDLLTKLRYAGSARTSSDVIISFSMIGW